ncbi:MAG: class I SAM-dependent methyltransferase [Oligoflexales bacterium]
MPPFLSTLNQQRKWHQFRKSCHTKMENMHEMEDPWDSHHNLKPIAYCSERILGKTKYQKGLEVGCGQGLLTPHWLTYCHSLTSLDISKLAIEKARQEHPNLDDRVQWVSQDIHKFHQSPDHYDAIFLSYVVDYLGYQNFPKQVTSTFLKLHHILKKGGDLIIINPMYSGDDLQKNLVIDQILQHIGFQMDNGLIQGKYPEQFSFRRLKKT